MPASLRASCESEDAEVKRGRPFGPTSSEGSFSSAARRRARALSSESAASKSSEAAAEAEGSSVALVSALDLPFLAFLTVDLVVLAE